MRWLMICWGWVDWKLGKGGLECMWRGWKRRRSRGGRRAWRCCKLGLLVRLAKRRGRWHRPN